MIVVIYLMYYVLLLASARSSPTILILNDWRIGLRENLGLEYIFGVGSNEIGFDRNVNYKL